MCTLKLQSHRYKRSTLLLATKGLYTEISHERKVGIYQTDPWLSQENIPIHCYMKAAVELQMAVFNGFCGYKSSLFYTEQLFLYACQSKA